jgi:hypothetical protein
MDNVLKLSNVVKKLKTNTHDLLCLLYTSYF